MERLESPCDQPVPGRNILTDPQRAARTIHRLLNRFVASGTELSALTVGANSIGAYLTIVGVDSDKVTVSLCAEAEGADDKAARNRAEQIHLTRIGDEIVLEVGEFSTQQRATGHLEILAPKERPIRIAGAFDEILINGMTRAVQVDAPRASVSILKTSGEVSVAARSIIYAGSSGVAKLHAKTMDTSHIDIKITANCFDGSFEAIASGLIRVLVPADFSGIQAIVERSSRLLCRANALRHMAFEKRQENVAFTHGRPTVTLLSRHGQVILDQY